MKTIGIGIAAVFIIAIGLAVGGGVFALLAYGMGWAISRITGFDLFQSTLVSMAGLFVFGILFERVFNTLTNMPPVRMNDDDEEEDWDEIDEFYDDDDDLIDLDKNFKPSDKEMDDLFPGIPRWRRPLKNIDFSNVKPDDRCPCGSGRKYKNCHGSKKKMPPA